MSDARVGDIFQDLDPRCEHRKVQVERLEGDFAWCVVLGTRRKTRISLQRLRPIHNGFRLVVGGPPGAPT